VTNVQAAALLIKWISIMIKILGLFLLLITQAVSAKVTIENWQTKQGSQVYFIQTLGLPMVDVQVVFDAGSARDGQQHGIAGFTSTLLDTGAGAWDANEIAERLENVGAQLSCTVSTDMATVSLRSLTEPKLLNSALETLQAVISKPRFAETDFKRDLSRTLAGLKQQEESPAAQAEIAFGQALYGDHPYAHDSSGDLKTVSALTISKVRDFYQRHYVAANALVVVVGNLEQAQAAQIAEKLMASLPVGQKPAPLPAVAMPQKTPPKHIEFPSTQTHVLVGLPVSYRQDPDYFTLYVGNHILGGSGLVSKLFDEIREKRGLAYSASSHFMALLKPGPFEISLQTRNEKTTEALQVLNQTLNDFINNGPTEAELKAAKQNITGGFAMRIDTNKELAGYAAMLGFYHLPLDYLDTFTQKIAQVTVADIKTAFKRRLPVDLLQTITVGKTVAPTAINSNAK
jgi:zinc protease